MAHPDPAHRRCHQGRCLCVDLFGLQEPRGPQAWTSQWRRRRTRRRGSRALPRRRGNNTATAAPPAARCARVTAGSAGAKQRHWGRETGGRRYLGKGLQVVLRGRPFDADRRVPVERNEGELGLAVEAALRTRHRQGGECGTAVRLRCNGAGRGRACRARDLDRGQGVEVVKRERALPPLRPPAAPVARARGHRDAVHVVCTADGVDARRGSRWPGGCRAAWPPPSSWRRRGGRRRRSRLGHLAGK